MAIRRYLKVTNAAVARVAVSEKDEFTIVSRSELSEAELLAATFILSGRCSKTAINSILSSLPNDIKVRDKNQRQTDSVRSTRFAKLIGRLPDLQPQQPLAATAMIRTQPAVASGEPQAVGRIEIHDTIKQERLRGLPLAQTFASGLKRVSVYSPFTTGGLAGGIETQHLTKLSFNNGEAFDVVVNRSDFEEASKLCRSRDLASAFEEKLGDAAAIQSLDDVPVMGEDQIRLQGMEGFQPIKLIANPSSQLASHILYAMAIPGVGCLTTIGSEAVRLSQPSLTFVPGVTLAKQVVRGENGTEVLYRLVSVTKPVASPG